MNRSYPMLAFIRCTAAIVFVIALSGGFVVGKIYAESQDSSLAVTHERVTERAFPQDAEQLDRMAADLAKDKTVEPASGE